MPQNDGSCQFVSRGGVKLQAALANFQIDAANKIVLDVGSSTGGFVDCLLQNGAKKVYALDTAYGELAWKLRNDPRVVVMERTNILYLKSLPHPVILNVAERSEESLANASQNKQSLRLGLKSGDSSSSPQNDNIKVDLITIDAGWTKLELVLPIVKQFLKDDGVIIALLKPHYEAQKKDLIKGVLPLEIAEQVKDQTVKKIQGLRFTIQEIIVSPILGGAGNTEYLLLIS